MLVSDQESAARPAAVSPQREDDAAALQQLSYEEAIQQLEKVVAKLESGDISLDESMALFKRGMSLSEICAGKLSAIEKQITQLLEKAGGELEEKPFGEENE
jgi:exodeoxyribonuclease VII small subunit